MVDEAALAWTRVRVSEAARSAQVEAAVRGLQHRCVEKLQGLRSRMEEDLAARAVAASKKAEGAAAAASAEKRSDYTPPPLYHPPNTHTHTH